MFLRRSRSSWLGRIDAETLKCPAERGEDGTQPSIDVKDAGQIERSGNLPHRSFVLEAKREQQAIGRIQLIECSGERGLELLAADSRIGLGSRCPDQLIGVDFLGDEILQPPPCPLLMLAIGVIASRTSVSLPEVVEDESPGDDDQPRREFYVWLGDVSAEPAAPVFPESL